MVTNQAETNYTEDIKQRVESSLFGKVVMVFLSFIMENESLFI